jgi:hypothetical protein
LCSSFTARKQVTHTNATVTIAIIVIIVVVVVVVEGVWEQSDAENIWT